MEFVTIEDIKTQSNLIREEYDLQNNSEFVTTVNAIKAQIENSAASKLANVYDLPFAVVPEMLKKAIIDSIIYNVLSSRAPGLDPAENKWVDRYKEAATTLDKIASGNMPIGYDNDGVFTIISPKTDAAGFISSDDGVEPLFVPNTVERNTDGTRVVITFKE